MGADHSTPLTATIELKLGADEDVVTIREVNRGNVPRENNGDGRTSGRSHQQRNQGQAEQYRSTGGCINPQQRNQGQAEQYRSTGGGRSLMQQRSQARAGYRQNVGFFKAGNLHRPAGQGVRVGDTNMAHHGRMSGQALGSRRRAPGARDGQAGRGRVVETVTLDSDSDNETLEEMEAKLVRMIEQRLKRKRSHHSL